MYKDGVMSQQQTRGQFSEKNKTQLTLGEELSEEVLSTLTGGMIPGAAGLADRIMSTVLRRRRRLEPRLTRSSSAPGRLETSPFTRMPYSPVSSHSGASDFEDGQGTSPVHPV